MANHHFADSCDRYTKIIETIQDENLFKTNRAIYDSRYLFEYGEDFIGYEAYKLRYDWLTRYGTDQETPLLIVMYFEFAVCVCNVLRKWLPCVCIEFVLGQSCIRLELLPSLSLYQVIEM